MKWIRILVIVILQITCVASAGLMLLGRTFWMKQVRNTYASNLEHPDQFETLPDALNGMEVNPTDLSIDADWPVHFNVKTGDPGLPPLVVALLLLFTFLVAMRKQMGHKFRIFCLGFLILLLSFSLGMVIQQNYFFQELRQSSDHRPVRFSYTTEHGVVFKIKGKDRHATVRDPNIIPALMIAWFLVSWIPLVSRDTSTRRAKPSLVVNAESGP
jgi:hypothetical protein